MNISHINSSFPRGAIISVFVYARGGSILNHGRGGRDGTINYGNEKSRDGESLFSFSGCQTNFHSSSPGSICSMTNLLSCGNLLLACWRQQ